jgi:hypothetical protein
VCGVRGMGFVSFADVHNRSYYQRSKVDIVFISSVFCEVVISKACIKCVVTQSFTSHLFSPFLCVMTMCVVISICLVLILFTFYPRVCTDCGEHITNQAMHNRLCARPVASQVTYRTSDPSRSFDVDIHRHLGTRLFYCVGTLKGLPCPYKTNDTDGIRVRSFIYLLGGRSDFFLKRHACKCTYDPNMGRPAVGVYF